MRFGAKNNKLKRSEDSIHPLISYPERYPKLVGIHGWLAFFVVSLFLTVALGIYNTASGLIEQTQISSDLVGLYPNIIALLSFENILKLLIVIFGLYLLIKIIKKEKVAVRLAVIFFVGLLVYTALDISFAYITFGDSPSVLNKAINNSSISLMILHALIWLPYFLFSKRVKATLTFVKPKTKIKYKKTFTGILKLIILAFTSLVLIMAILVGCDYINYRAANRTILFGTLDNYPQAQTLKFENLNLKVISVSSSSYPKPVEPVQLDCSGLSTTLYSRSSDWLLNLKRIGNSPYSECQDGVNNYFTEMGHYKAKNELAVKFQYSNISDKPLNLSDFQVKVIANTSLDSYYPPLTTCSGMQTSTLLKGSTIIECLSMDIDKGYYGPLVLSVIKNGKEKDIKLSFPSIVLLN